MHDNPTVNLRGRSSRRRTALPRLLCSLGPDTDGELLDGILEGSSDRLDLAVYELGPAYAGLVAATARRGARVRVLLDGHSGANSTTFRLLAGCGAEVRVWPHGRGGEAHWKLVAVGAGTLAVGSGNLIARDAPRRPAGRAGTREWWMALTGARGLCARARGAIDAAWGRAEPPPAEWGRAAAAAPPVGVPHPAVPTLEVEIDEAAVHLATGAVRVAALTARRLGGVRRRALCTVPYAHPGVSAVARLLDALAAARRRGADVRLLLGAPPERAHLEAIRALGIPVRVMDPARSTTGHAKGLVADGVAVAGSANWSHAGLSLNLEAALAVEHRAAADFFAAAFERDWEASEGTG